MMYRTLAIYLLQVNFIRCTSARMYEYKIPNMCGALRKATRSQQIIYGYMVMFISLSVWLKDNNQII